MFCITNIACTQSKFPIPYPPDTGPHHENTRHFVHVDPKSFNPSRVNISPFIMFAINHGAICASWCMAPTLWGDADHGAGFT